MSGGYGGTIKVAFFPQEVVKMLESMGFKKSKKGKWYKKYQLDQLEFIAMPSCKEDVKGNKGAGWYIFDTEEHKEIYLDEARRLSNDYDTDYVEIRELMIELQ